MGALNNKQKQVLWESGFTRAEIAAYNGATTPDGEHFQHIDITTKAWKANIARRSRAYNKLIKKGFKDTDIRAQFQRYYVVRGGQSPWDFLKVEYKPPKMTKDYLTLDAQLRNRMRIKFGTGYIPATRTGVSAKRYQAVMKTKVKKGQVYL